MLIEVKELEDSKVNIKFEADPVQVDSKRAEIIEQFRKGTVPGYRPGKATADAVKYHFSTRIDDVVKQEMAQSAFSSSCAEKNIKPFGQPQFLSLYLDGSKFTCDFSVNKMPSIELKQYKEFELPKGHIPDAVEMAERIIQEIRTKNGEISPFGEDDFVQDGDNVIVNYHGTMRDNPSEAMHKDGDIFVVGKSPISEFNENMLGMKVGERRDFGARYNDREMNFSIELVMASKSAPAALDDELAKKIGAKDANDMINMIRSTAGNRVEELKQKYLTEQLALRLVEAHDITIPGWLASFEAQLMARQHGGDWDNMSDADKENFLRYATRNLKLSLIMEKIREEEPDAQLTDEEVLKLIRNNINKYKQMLPDEIAAKGDNEIFETILRTGYMQSFVASVRDDHVMSWLLTQSKVVE